MRCSREAWSWACPPMPSTYLHQCVLTALQAHGLLAPRQELASLVKCLRISQTAQTQQLVLGLLSLAALHYPEEVLHNVTSVFTYKGASLLWQVDNCSFQTVMPTVKTVMPALLQACTGESKSAEAAESAVASVTRVFVGPFLDIPEHWWLSLFAKLATTLGAGDHLWILAAQMAEHQVTKMGGTDVDEVTFVRYMSGRMKFRLTLRCSCCRTLSGADVPPAG
ncbi:HEAT repeat-containing protein 1-like [Amblyomma americanum]